MNELDDMIYRRSFCENDVFGVFWSTGAIMSQKLSKHDGNWFPTCNIIILVFQIIYSTFKTLILLLIRQMHNIVYVLVKT